MKKIFCDSCGAELEFGTPLVLKPIVVSFQIPMPNLGPNNSTLYQTGRVSVEIECGNNEICSKCKIEAALPVLKDRINSYENPSSNT